MKLAHNVKGVAPVVAEAGAAVTVVVMAAVAGAVATAAVAQDAAVGGAEEAIAVTVEDMEAEAADEIVNQKLYRRSKNLSRALSYSAPFLFQIAPRRWRCCAMRDIATPLKLRF